jgi:hypothetical protein
MVKDPMAQAEDLQRLRVLEAQGAVMVIHMALANPTFQPTLPLITRLPLFKWVDFTEAVVVVADKVAANNHTLDEAAQAQ